MTDYKLKPCKNCGNRDVVIGTIAPDWAYYVRCYRCDHRTLNYCAISDAVNAWNKGKEKFKKND